MSERKKKILVCNLPTAGLFEKTPYMEISLGAACLAGALKDCNYDVDYLDFGIALNSLKKENRLAPEEEEIISTPKKVALFLSDKKKKTSIYLWAKKLCSYLKGKKYDYICLSIERKTTKHRVLKAAINFGIILADMLPKKMNTLVFMGGRNALRDIGQNYLKEIDEELEKNPVDVFFLNAKACDFIKYIYFSENKKKLEKNDLEKITPFFSKNFLKRKNSFRANKILNEKIIRKTRGIQMPSYNLFNKKELYFDLKRILPDKLLKLHPKLKKIESFFAVPLMFTLGCPFRCAFCRQGTEDYFFPSAKEAVDTIEGLVRDYGVKYFRFYNSHINFSEKYAIDFANEIKKRNLKIKFSDSANLRFASKKVVSSLKEAGCLKLWYGVETASPKILKIMNKALTPEEIKKGLDNSAKAGIWSSVNLIVNFPHETKNDFDILVDFLKMNRKNIDCWKCNIFGLYTDTHIYNNPKKYGVRIRGLTEESRGCAYDEVGGLRWERKQKLGRKRIKKIKTLLNYEENLILRNDYLLFGFSQITNNRLELKKIMADYIRIVKEKIKTENFLNNHSFASFAKNIDPETI